MKRKFPARIFRASVFVCAALFSAAALAGSGFNRIVVFGDSLSDPGNAFVVTHRVSVPPYQLIPEAPYARGGLHFSNGPTWIEQLARERPGFQGVCAALLLRGVCTDYAVGGARARPGAPFDLSSQVAMYLDDFHGAASPTALYVVHIGGNDLRDALEVLATDPAASFTIIGAALNKIAANVTALRLAGASEFLVPNAPNFKFLPAVRLQGAPAQFGAELLSVAYNQNLEVVLAGLETGLGITIHRLDVFALIDAAVASPAAYGFTEVESPCITPGVVAHAACTQPDEFLFWDGIHPTRSGHAILADKAKEILASP